MKINDEAIKKKIETLKNDPETIKRIEEIDKVFKILAKKSEYSAELKKIEDMFEKKLKRKTTLLDSIYQYKFFLCEHFLAVEKQIKD